MRIALGLEYDGRPFCGWQSQKGGGSVQDALEAALAEIAGRPVRVVAAGRTDTGVHASMQVVHFDTDVNRPQSAWVRGANAHLPDAVAILWAQEVGADFHARFSARERSYRYLLLNRPVRPAIASGRVGWLHLPLDSGRLRAAAALLVGEHDFGAFRAAECQAKTAVRTVSRLTIERHGDLLVIDVWANAFLHHMVRNIVGSLVYVGKGRHPPHWIRDVLESRDRKLAAPTFAADGLYLSSVRYAPPHALPSEAAGLDALLLEMGAGR
ncbi:MAG TPA: tRNA pseudouridine(38-40) synthase TruA [Pelomicrobium sp.]|nr:tRNA pseudouridine(38-40) synthase TruA [Pelomicrobium sp.]